MQTPVSERRWIVAFCAIVAAEVVAAFALTGFGYSMPDGVVNSALFAVLAVATWSAVTTFIWTVRLWRAGVESPLREINRETLRRGLANLAARVLPPIGIAVFGVWFGVLKQLVPVFGGFRLDADLANLDYVLFLGHDPWKLSHALFGQFAGLIDYTYSLWLAVLLIFPSVLSITAPSALRARFFLSWILSWLVLGMVVAIALASAGPMFLGDMRLPGADHYRGLLNALSGAPVTLKIHTYLWGLYQHGETRLGGGISAAPSMHVAMAWLYVLTAWRWWKPLAIPAIGFFVIILVGSVFLGYHYAVDGLISIGGVSMIWVLVGRWVDGHKLTIARWGFAPLPKPAGE